MDFDVPTDLINKAQIGFREAAGLPLFDRNNTTLPSIPTVEATISTLDPSPPHLRCKYCHGKLLRGLQSLICIYCGEYQRNDRNPDPISFNSTHGYSWLLQSLNFNGSERIGSLAEGSGINGGQSPAEDELTLSELLDLKLLWRDVPKKPEIKFHINTSEHSSSTNLGSTDFDSFFTEAKRAAIVSDIPEEQPVASKNDLNQAFEGQENLTSVTSSIDEHDDASFGWNAEFQSADMKMENEKPESVDLFVGAEADISAQMDVVFGPVEGFSNKKPNDDLDPFQDDLFANMKSASFQKAEQLDSVVQAKDNLSGHLNDVNSKDLDGDWFNDGTWQKNSAENTLGKPNDDLDPFQDDLFVNMKSASSQQAEQLDPVVQPKDNLSGHLNDVNSKDLDGGWFNDGNWQKNSAENTLGKPNDDLDPFQDDLFVNMKSASSQQAEQLDPVVQPKANLSGHLNDVNSKDLDGGWFNDGNWQKNSAENTLGKPNDDLDPFQDDLFVNMKSASSQQAEQLDPVVQPKANLSGHLNDVNSKDLDGGWFNDGNWQKNSAENTLGKPNDDLDPFQDDLFANMKSASSQQAEQLDSVVEAKDNLSGHLNDANSKNLDGAWFSDSNWQKNSAENTLGKPNDSSIDRFENTNWQNSSTTGKTGTIKDDNLFNIKPQVDLILSEKSDLDNSDKHHSDTTTDWFQDSQWVIGGSSSTTNMMASNDDDGFDEWNDFTSSTDNQASFQDSWKENSNEKFGTSEKISDLNLFPSTADPQEVDFGNFLQSDISSGDKIPNDTRVAYDIFSEASTSIGNANAVAGNSAKGAKNDEVTPNATASSKNDVQMLLSQMHDLSFMLKSELSVPSKADDLGSSHS